jgi:hypothetical protein
MSTLNLIAETATWLLAAAPPENGPGGGGGFFGTINDLNSEADASIKAVASTVLTGIFVWRAAKSQMAAGVLIMGMIVLGFALAVIWDAPFLRDLASETLNIRSLAETVPGSTPIDSVAPLAGSPGGS